MSDGGGTGADVLNGYFGNDTYIVRSAGTTIDEVAGRGTSDRVAAALDYALAADDDIELMTTTSTAGTAAIDLTGNALAQTITGNAGDNVLHSGGGAADVLQGLGGNDVYRVFNAGDVIVETAGNGTNDRVMAAVSFALAAGDDIELFTTNRLDRHCPDKSDGQRDCADHLRQCRRQCDFDGGGAGADDLRGLGGSDTYIIYNGGTTIVEAALPGNVDRVAAGVDYVLGAGVYVELMTTTSSGSTLPIDLTGNELAQEIIGNAGNNVLSDGAIGDADVLRGLGGNDTYIVRNVATQIQEGASQGTNDTVAVSAQTYVLQPGIHAEVLRTTSNGGMSNINLTEMSRRKRLSAMREVMPLAALAAPTSSSAC